MKNYYCHYKTSDNHDLDNGNDQFLIILLFYKIIFCIRIISLTKFTVFYKFIFVFYVNNKRLLKIYFTTQNLIFFILMGTCKMFFNYLICVEIHNL